MRSGRGGSEIRIGCESRGVSPPWSWDARMTPGRRHALERPKATDLLFLFPVFVCL